MIDQYLKRIVVMPKPITEAVSKLSDKSVILSEKKEMKNTMKTTSNLKK
jgi:hypothetical protein